MREGARMIEEEVEREGTRGEPGLDWKEGKSRGERGRLELNIRGGTWGWKAREKR